MEWPQRQKQEKKQQQPQSVSTKAIQSNRNPNNKSIYQNNLLINSVLQKIKRNKYFNLKQLKVFKIRQDRSQKMNTSKDRSRNKIPAKSNPKYKQQQVQQEPAEEWHDEDQFKDLKISIQKNIIMSHTLLVIKTKNKISKQRRQLFYLYKPRKSIISVGLEQNNTLEALQKMDFYDLTRCQ